ncbi:MAG: response regulator [Burkholderiaceae bacterium]|nr:response regulator [Burkholderiaceae bacterium]
MRVLLVEDDPMIGDAVERGLRGDGYAVDRARDAGEADTALRAQPRDLVLLDLGLPGGDGLALLRAMRARGDATPVVVVTARDAVAARIAGLDAGADDYVVKPFEIEELGARIRAVLRRRAGRSEPLLRAGAVCLDPATHRVTVDGAPVALSAREYALLRALMDRPGAVLSRAQLEEKLYGWNEPIGSNAVEVHLHALRRKLGPGVVRNVRGVGWTMADAP